MKRSFLVALAIFALASFLPRPLYATPPVSPTKFHEVKRFELGGDGRWDYLTMDADAHRLYVSRSSHVMVVDIQTGKTVGDIPGTTGVHGIALYPAKNRGFTSNGGDNTVTVFDLKTLKEIKRIKVGEDPDGILFDPVTKRIFTFNGDGESTTAIDADTLAVIGQLPLGGKPESSVSDGRGIIFVNIEDKSEIAAFDAKTLKVTARFPLAPGESAAGLAMDRKNRRLFSTCHNEKMVVLDADTGKVIASPAIGKGTDFAVFDDTAGLAFSSNGDGTLTVVQTIGKDNYSVAANVVTAPGARTMALDPKTHTIYLATAKPAPRVAGERYPSPVPNSFAIVVIGQ